MDLNQDKYKLFLDWFISNGGKYQQSLIQYPVYFSPGNYPGVGAKTQIPRNKVVLAIPFNLIITVNRVKQQLKQLYEDVYKQQDDEEQDLEFLVLTLYLTYHRQKGKQSFFYHYLNLVESPENMCDWSSSQIVESEDPYLIGSLQQQKEQIPLLFDIYRKYVLKYSHLFKEQVTMKQFMWSLNFVQTRCYGWGFPETLLAPFADLFNHNSQETIGHYMFKTDYEGKDSKPPKIYIVKADCLNIELMGIESREAKRYQPNDRIATLKRYYPEIEENELVENQEIYWERYLQQELVKHPLTTETLESDDEEDNDSDQQQSQQQQQQNFQSKIQLLRIAENPPQKYLSLELKDYKSPSLPINRQFQQQCDFSWYSHKDKQTYFIISTGKRTKKGEQLFNSYGSRNNRFLLTWYGFSLLKNKYNSVPFKLVLDNGNKAAKLEVYEKYVTLDEMENGMKLKGSKKKIEVSEYLTDEFRLKQNRLCEKLIMYIRFRELKRTEDKSVKVTFPTSLKHQLVILKVYEQIIEYLRVVYKSETLKEDLELFNKAQGLKERHLFALIHRINNKRIIETQWSLVRMAQKIIYDMIDGKRVEEALNTPREEERDELLGNSIGRTFYIRRLLRYIKPLSYLMQ